MPEVGDWHATVVRLPEGYSFDDPPDPLVDWEAQVVQIVRIGPDGQYSLGNLPEGMYKFAIHVLDGNYPSNLAVWETVEIGEEDLLLDYQADEQRYSHIVVPRRAP